MAGLGGSPIGSTPFGFGTPTTASAPPEDAPERARFIDPNVKDPSLATDGEFERMPIVRQMVVLALTTTRGSSSVLPDFGVRIEEKIDDSFVQRQEQNVRDALAHIPATMMRLTRVSVVLVPPTGRSEITVSYDDLVANLSNQSLTI